MTDKEIAINAVHQMPESATLEEIHAEIVQLATKGERSPDNKTDASADRGGQTESVWPSKF